MINLETFDLTQLPTAEDDAFEFKSSGISDNDLKKKLSCAASGFANSGGGCFAVGIDGAGNADGGFPLKIGKQDLRDWVDNVVRQVEPVPKYEVKLIQDATGRGIINSDLAVLLVVIHESYSGPHMAPDHHYYIRAGAHTVKAKHFLIDAIWAKRHFSKPRLTHLFRLKPGKEEAIQLGIHALTDAPAINVEVTLAPLPQMLQRYDSHFPLQAPLIDRNNSFFFDVTTYHEAIEKFGANVHLNVKYFDLAGNPYEYTTDLEISGSLPPLVIGNDNPAKIVKILESIGKVLSNLTIPRESVVKPSFVLSKPSEGEFPKIEGQIPKLLAEMRTDLLQHPFAREFVTMPEGSIYNGTSENLVLQYYFETHPYLRSKLRILENYGLIHEITYNNCPRFVISEELAAYLIKSQPQ